jgi:hypothetical protein
MSGSVKSIRRAPTALQATSCGGGDRAPGKTPSGKEAASYVRRLHHRIGRHWPSTHLTIRSDGHYGRPEMMDFCEKQGLDYLFGVTGAPSLAAKVGDLADPIRL